MGKEIKRSYSKGLSRANLKILLTTIVTKPGDGMFEVATTHAPKETKTKTKTKTETDTDTKTKATKKKTTKTNAFHHGSENQKNKPIAPSGKLGENGERKNKQISSGDKAMMRKMSKKTKMTKRTRWKKMAEFSNGRKGSESPRSSYRRQPKKKVPIDDKKSKLLKRVIASTEGDSNLEKAT